LPHDVEQAREGEQSLELLRSPAQMDAAAEPLRRELEPCERIDRNGVRPDVRSHVAEDDVGLTTGEQHPETLAKRGQVGAADGPADLEDQRMRPWRGHRLNRPAAGAKVIVSPTVKVIVSPTVKVIVSQTVKVIVAQTVRVIVVQTDEFGAAGQSDPLKPLETAHEGMNR
jgi:hypothetical protein